MKTRINPVLIFALELALAGATLTMAQPAGAGPNVPPSRPKGPCDIYAAAGDPCVAAHSTTRAFSPPNTAPLSKVRRQWEEKTMDLGFVNPGGGEGGESANA